MSKSRSVMIGVFDSAYIIALLLFLAGSIGSLVDGVVASRGLGVAELAAVGLVYPYAKTVECISLLFSSGSQVVIGRKIGKNEFGEVSNDFENLGIKILKSIADDIKYSFVYGVNFITITV